jgi:hypothetical protein
VVPRQNSLSGGVVRSHGKLGKMYIYIPAGVCSCQEAIHEDVFAHGKFQVVP